MKAALFVFAFLILAGCFVWPEGWDRADNLRLRYSPSGQISLGSTNGISLYDQNLIQTGSFGGIRCYHMDDFIWLTQSSVISAYEKSGQCNGSGFYIISWDNRIAARNITLPPPDAGPAGYNPVLSVSNDSKFIALTYENYNYSQEQSFGGFYLISTDNLSVISNVQTSGYPKTHFSPDGKYLGVLIPFTAISIYSIPGEILKNNFSTVGAEDFGWLNDTDMLLLENSRIVSVDPFNQSDLGKLRYDVNCNQLVGYYCSLNQIEVSPNGRYVAVGGSYAVNEDSCHVAPGGVYPCSEGFIAVVDLEKNATVFWNQGGQAHDNSAVFDWSPDGNELAYTFDGSIFKQKISG